MPKVASYTVVRDGDLTLPDNGDIDFDFPEFSLPNLSASESDPDRPILSFKVNPLSDDARVVLFLNEDEDDVLYAQTYGDGPIRTVTEVVARNKFRASGNKLSVRREGTGTFVISDVTLTYKADV
jgi:hypothetical protein